MMEILIFFSGLAIGIAAVSFYFFTKKGNTPIDLKRLEKFEQIRDQIRWWGPTTVMQIEDEALRKKAIAYVKDIEEFCAKLLEQMAKDIED